MPHGRNAGRACIESYQQLKGEQSMSSVYTVMEDNALRLVEAQREPVGRAFASVEEFAELVADWPLRSLVEIWNKLPGVRPLSRFENREVAVQRIWRALHNEQQ